MAFRRAAGQMIGWLERPIGLFLMTSLLVPVLGTAFTDRAQCLRDATDFPYRLSSVVAEYGYREQAFRLVQVSATAQTSSPAAKRLADLARGEDYLSGDYKGRSMIDLVNEIKQRWMKMAVTPDVVLAVWHTHYGSAPLPPLNAFNLPLLDDQLMDYQPNDTATLLMRYLLTDAAKRDAEIRDESARRDLIVAIVQGARFSPKCGFFRSLFRSLSISDDEQILVTSF